MWHFTPVKRESCLPVRNIHGCGTVYNTEIHEEFSPQMNGTKLAKVPDIP